MGSYNNIYPVFDGNTPPQLNIPYKDMVSKMRTVFEIDKNKKWKITIIYSGTQKGASFDIEYQVPFTIQKEATDFYGILNSFIEQNQFKVNFSGIGSTKTWTEYTKIFG